MAQANTKLSASPVSIADVTTAVANIQKQRRVRLVLSPEEKSKRRSSAVNEAVARFGVAPPGAFFRQPAVQALLGVSAATLWRWVKLHPELQPIKMGERVTAWTASQIRAFMQSRMVAA